MGIIIQIIKEFWIPFLISATWTIYIGWSNGFKLEIDKIISSFASSFFLASWMLGQVFRIAKQIKTEKNFNSIEGRLQSLLDKIEQKTIETIGHISGGSSYPFLITSHMGNKILLSLAVYGDYPLRNLDIGIRDITNRMNQDNMTIDQIISDSTDFGEKLYSGDASNISAIILRSFPIVDDTHKVYRIRFRCLNGMYSETIEIKIINGIFSVKSELFDINGNKIKDQISDNFG